MESPRTPHVWTSIPHPSRILSSGTRTTNENKVDYMETQSSSEVVGSGIKEGSVRDAELEIEPAYKKFLLSPNAPLISAHVKFSLKRSIAQDDDD